MTQKKTAQASTVIEVIWMIVWDWYVTQAKAQKHPTAAKGSTATGKRGRDSHVPVAPGPSNVSMAKPKDAYEELEVEIEVRHKSYNRFGYTSRNGVVTTRKDRKIVL